MPRPRIKKKSPIKPIAKGGSGRRDKAKRNVFGKRLK